MVGPASRSRATASSTTTRTTPRPSPARASAQTAMPCLLQPRVRRGRSADRARGSSSRTSWPASPAATRRVFPASRTSTSIMRYHDARDDRRSEDDLGRARGQSDAGVASGTTARCVPIDFCINVTLNRDRADHAVLLRRRAARRTTQAARSHARRRWCACDRPFPIVVTTNSGYPLDQNLYQAVKGMSAAAQVVDAGGYIATAARCNDGFPAHGNFRTLLMRARLAASASSTRSWRRVSALRPVGGADAGEHPVEGASRALQRDADDDVRRAHLEPVRDIAARSVARLPRRGRDANIAVLPEGPMTIPYLA